LSTFQKIKPIKYQERFK